MGRKPAPESLEIHEGVYLTFKGGAYHTYFRVGGTPFRRSTKTKNLADAKYRALGWHRDAQRKLEAGEDVECISFAKLKRSYLDHIKSEGKHAYHSATTERHFLPFFSKFDDISKIKKSDILDYLNFRRAKGVSPPTPQTINRENTVLRQMFRYAVEKGWLRTAVSIANESERQSRRRRSHFTLEEYRTLYRTARKRVRELDGIPLKTLQREQRQLLLDYILLLSNTGMRVDESKTLIWRNVDWEKSTVLLVHAGKMKSTRTVMIRPGGMAALRRIEERRRAYLQTAGKPWDPKSFILAMPDGTRVKSLKKGFNQLLDACGFKYDEIHEKHTLTSLRHTYATFRLTTKKGKRATPKGLAKQMGTSERMIEKHYGHDLVEDYREELMG